MTDIRDLMPRRVGDAPPGDVEEWITRGQPGVSVNVKARWIAQGALGPNDEDEAYVWRVCMLEPRDRQCNKSCPWRVASFGTAPAFEYDHEVIGRPSDSTCRYSDETYAGYWEMLRTGSYDWANLCHVARRGTRAHDPSWSPGGTVPLADGRRVQVDQTHVVCQCTGSYVLQQREVLRHVETGTSAMTPAGAARIAGEMLGRPVTEDELSSLDVRELLRGAHPALLNPDIGSPHLAPLSADERGSWGSGERAARFPKTGRNDPCPCGSGLKHKRCHGR
jgi:hypothetical protein